MSNGTDEGRIEIRRALVSVYDKTGLEDLVRGLDSAGVALVSTGGSAALIESLGIAVTRVEDLTGFPECLDGRVKTLHPRVHAGILADRRLPSHVQQLADLDVEPFDLVVSNLYPFTQTVMSGASAEECVEQIDIGGPSMVRAAAKNHPSVAIVTSPDRYVDVLGAVEAGGFTLEERQLLAAEAFVHTATYDVAVASWMGNVLTDTVPAFRFMAWKNGVVKGLPVPSTPFGLDLHHSNISDSGVQELLSFKSLHTLDLANTNVTDAGIKDFSKLKGLRSVNLHGTKISIVGLKELAGLKLKKLGIPIALTDESLKHFLAALEPPTALRLFETQVTELGMKDLAGATSLQILDLGYLPVTDNGLKNLAGLTNLQTLDLRGTKVTGTGLSDLAGLKNLHTLNLSNNHVTEAGLKELARLNNLRTLHLGCIKISDAGLKEIVSLRNLEVLYLESTLLTSTQRTELRKALQNCLIR